MIELGGGDGVATLRCVCGETEPKVMVEHRGIDGVRYERPTDVCPWYLHEGPDVTPYGLGPENAACGMRCWAVERVEATCPHCGWVNDMPADTLTDREIWSSGSPWEHVCERCHRTFWIEVEDDDR